MYIHMYTFYNLIYTYLRYPYIQRNIGLIIGIDHLDSSDSEDSNHLDVSGLDPTARLWPHRYSSRNTWLLVGMVVVGGFVTHGPMVHHVIFVNYNLSGACHAYMLCLFPTHPWGLVRWVPSLETANWELIALQKSMKCPEDLKIHHQILATLPLWTLNDQKRAPKSIPRDQELIWIIDPSETLRIVAP